MLNKPLLNSPLLNIIVNDNPINCEEGTSIQKMLSTLKLESLEGMAVAVNNEVIHKSQWVDHILTENDKIIIIRATQGG